MEVGAFPAEARGRNAVHPSPDDPFQTALELGLGSPAAQPVSDDGKGPEEGPDSGVSPAAMEEGFKGAFEGVGEGSAMGAVPGQVAAWKAYGWLRDFKGEDFEGEGGQRRGTPGDAVRHLMWSFFVLFFQTLVLWAILIRLSDKADKSEEQFAEAQGDSSTAPWYGSLTGGSRTPGVRLAHP
ncbi:hypothetical protein T484DRAFT_1777328 [Baffinella frigidus]|nr:hypothetical protein T484DRAFT_1777328 [Cryptophyta sp. CCMP2293]